MFMELLCDSQAKKIKAMSKLDFKHLPQFCFLVPNLHKVEASVAEVGNNSLFWMDSSV